MLDRADRLLLIGAGLLLAFAVALTLLFDAGSRSPEVFQTATSYENGGGGAKATFLLLGELGYAAERWEHSPAALPEAGEDSRSVVLVLAEPRVRPTSRERAELARFVEAGGHVLVAGDVDSLFDDARTEDLGIANPERCTRHGLGPLTQRVPEIALRPVARWRRDVADAETLYTGTYGPTAVAWRRGAGDVVWWAGTTPLTNRGIDDPASLALLTDALGPPRRTRVLWDEYFHGERGTLAGYLGRTPLRWGALQALLLFAAVCFTFARRTGPVRTPGAVSRASLLEFVDALGGLYARAGATRAVVRLALDDFRLRLLKRLGLPPGTSDDALAAAAERRLGGGAALAALLVRARRVERVGIDDEDALALVRGLDEWDRASRRSHARTDDGQRTQGA